MPLPLVETYRPRTLADVLAQPRAVASAQRILDRGTGGARIWLSGPTGTGKTTLAKILALAHTDNDPRAVTEIDCAKDITSETLDAIDRALTFRPLWGGKAERRAWIINEAHGLRPSAVQRLLGLLERIGADGERVMIIFTTTWEGQDALESKEIDFAPLLARCSRIGTTNQGVQSAAPMIMEIAQREGLDGGHPLSKFQAILKECNSSIRAALQMIDDGELLRVAPRAAKLAMSA